MKTITVAFLLTLGFVAILLPEKSDAVCCGSECGDNCAQSRGLCHDCTRSRCCGVGRCNIFCCNCDDGCRDGIKCWNCGCAVARSPGLFGVSLSAPGPAKGEEQIRGSIEHVDRIFIAGDASHDEKLSYEEAIQWAQIGNSAPFNASDFELELKKLDLDQDGFLTKDEIDPEYSVAVAQFAPTKQIIPTICNSAHP